MPDNHPSLVATLERLETALHQASVRQQRDSVAMLLHPAFEEVGRSGQRYTRAEIIDALAQESTAPALVSDAYQATEISVGVVLLSYRSAQQLGDGRRVRHTLRSSLWQWHDQRWQLRFHQGTPAAETW